MSEEEQPRAYTEEEVVGKLIEHFRSMVSYWKNVKLDPEMLAETGETDIEWRLSGLMRSMLATLDGSSIALPAFDLKPAPHPTDKEFHQSEGENWFDENQVISVSLHDHLYAKKP